MPTKEQKAESQKKYYEANKEKVAEKNRKYQKKYQENNKEKIAERNRKYLENNREKIHEAKKQYRENNKEKVAKAEKQYRENNKEKVAEARKQYLENNKEKVAETRKQYLENNREKIKQYQQSPMGKRISRISGWKKQGIKLPEEYGENWDIFYEEEYLNTTKCEECGVNLTEDKMRTSTTKCLDHNHITGDFRNVLCHACNIQRG
tara:strand:- start:14 stop:631 length:618 start_codon:yes stop_codon:yes gene_type:complete